MGTLVCPFVCGTLLAIFIRHVCASVFALWVRFVPSASPKGQEKSKTQMLFAEVQPWEIHWTKFLMCKIRVAIPFSSQGCDGLI